MFTNSLLFAALNVFFKCSLVPRSEQTNISFRLKQTPNTLYLELNFKWRLFVVDVRFENWVTLVCINLTLAEPFQVTTLVNFCWDALLPPKSWFFFSVGSPKRESTLMYKTDLGSLWNHQISLGFVHPSDIIKSLMSRQKYFLNPITPKTWLLILSSNCYIKIWF